MKKNRIDEGETGGRGSVNDAIAAAPAGVLRPGPVAGLSDSYVLAFVVGFFVLFSLFWLILWGAQQGDEAKEQDSCSSLASPGQVARLSAPRAAL